MSAVMSADTLLTEITNEPGFHSASSPFAVCHATFVVNLEAHLLVTLRKAIQTTLMGIDELQGLLVSRVSVAKGTRVRLQPTPSALDDFRRPTKDRPARHQCLESATLQASRTHRLQALLLLWMFAGT